MMKWKMSNSRRKRKEKMKLMVWMEEMGEIGIDRRGVYLPIREG